MPPRWSEKPSRQDPKFRKLDDRYTWGAHMAIYSPIATGLIFFRMLWHAEWPWVRSGLALWALILGIHTFWVLVIARYPEAESAQSESESDPTSTSA